MRRVKCLEWLKYRTRLKAREGSCTCKKYRQEVKIE
jgi:hypothetical protein